MGYTLTFVSLRAQRTYSLLINSGGTAIDGAAQAFETVEDNSEDFFMPVRTQSGSFRFIGTGSAGRTAWLAMIPSNALSVPVKLTHVESGSTVIDWQGYVQPQVFQNDYPYNGTSEHDIPVQCPLSVLDTIDIDTDINNHDVVTVGQLLHTYIFSKLTGTTIGNYYIQGNLVVTRSRLNIKLMWANFLETDSQGNIKPKYTCKQVLEEVCKFFGWTCRMHGTDIYFTMPVDNNYGFSSYSGAAMTNVNGSGSYISRQNLTITYKMFVDTDNNEEVVPGIGKVTVRSDINELDNLIEIPYDELYDQYNVGIPQNSIIVRPVDYYEREVYNLIRQPNTNSGVLEYQNDTVSLRCFMPTVPGIGTDAGNNKKYCRFFVYDDGDVGSYEDQKIPESKEQFSWRRCIEVFHSYLYSGGNTADLFRISSMQSFVITNGMLYINFKCDQVSAWISENTEIWYGNVSKSYCYAIARLRIGNNYWDGNNRTWTTNSNATFELPFTSSGAKSNRSQYGGIRAPQYNGFGIQVTDTMRGDMEFTVVDVPPFQVGPSLLRIDINGFMSMLDFEIGFVRGVIEDTQHRGNEYIMRGGNFREETNVDLIFASDVAYGSGDYVRHMPAGLGYILTNIDVKPAATIQSMSGTSVIPEEELARIISVYGSSTHRVVHLDLNSALLNSQNGSDPKPTQMSNTSQELSDIGNFFPLAISRNWRDDITTLTLIKL